ncbi:hypothetical protein FACS1894170_05000 [Planctomycetales bacterium]|nr:hypothetical protein FACS1894170_05000 [Planctomycetales bacterium]
MSIKSCVSNAVQELAEARLAERLHRAALARAKIAATLLAILLGGWGVHKFYMGSWGWGLVFIGFVILTVGAGALITYIASLVDGIRYLMMTDDDFAAKYPIETQAPFRW